MGIPIAPMFYAGENVIHDSYFFQKSLGITTTPLNLTEGKNYEVLDVELAFSKHVERIVVLDDKSQLFKLSPLWFSKPPRSLERDL